MMEPAHAGAIRGQQMAFPSFIHPVLQWTDGASPSRRRFRNKSETGVGAARFPGWPVRIRQPGRRSGQPREWGGYFIYTMYISGYLLAMIHVG